MKTSSGWRFELYEDNQRFNEISTRIRLSRRVLDLTRSEGRRMHSTAPLDFLIKLFVFGMSNLAFSALLLQAGMRTMYCGILVHNGIRLEGIPSISLQNSNLLFDFVSNGLAPRQGTKQPLISKKLLNLIEITQQGLVANDDGLGHLWSLRTLF